VLNGSGKGLVVATGLQTEIGKIHTSVQEVTTQTPIAQELEHLSRWILIFILVLCVLLFVVGVISGRPIKELLVMLVALFICVVPEGLPVVLTLVLATGVNRMARRNVLVKHMQAVEGLGRTDVVIIDKTGTLTHNEMMVIRVIVDDKTYTVSGQGYNPKGTITIDTATTPPSALPHEIMPIATAVSLLNTAEIHRDEQTGLYTIKGDPTEAALYVFSQKIGMHRTALDNEYRKVCEIPFDSNTHYHAAFYEHDGKGIAFIAGSPELLISKCAKVSPATLNAFDQLLNEGLRTVAVVQTTFDIATMHAGTAQEKEHTNFCKRFIDGDLQLMGLFGIQDAIRQEVSQTVERARDAGLMIVMATGDHQKTALYVAKAVGIFHEGDRVIDGTTLATMSDADLAQAIATTTVYCRLSPDQKLRLVKAFHAKNKLVAMTGDGINDAPSLVAADLGIAMGTIGTEVAKNSADLILLDDSFNSIVNAIKEGRHIFYALKRVVLYFFATNFGEIVIVLLALICNFPLPLTAAQILWLNLVTDGFLDIGLSLEPMEKDLLEQHWLTKRMRLVDGPLLAKMVYMALPMGVGSLVIFNHYYQADLPLARTMTLLTMAMFQWFNAWNCRSEKRSIFELGLLTNRPLLLATGFVLFLQIVLVYAPFMQTIFTTVPLSGQQWFVIFAVSSSILFIEELRKRIAKGF